MTNTVSHKGFDITKRIDGSFAVYDYGWAPDEYLDADPELNAIWLEQTGGWRAKAWQIVHVASSLASARDWCNSAAGGVA